MTGVWIKAESYVESTGNQFERFFLVSNRF